MCCGATLGHEYLATTSMDLDAGMARRLRAVRGAFAKA
jgi:hypothetical protein